MPDATQPLTWINKRQDTVPDWIVAAMVSRKPEPNGTFLIRTKRGQARVHVGHMVIERGGDIYACHPSEARGLIAELEESERGAERLNAEARATHGRKPAQDLTADVADRSDDTDDISRRIEASRSRASDECVQWAEKHAAEAARNPQPPVPREQSRIIKDMEAMKRRRWPAPLGMPPSIEMRHPNELKIDDSYQRSIDTGPSRSLIDRIARGWDWRMCLPLVVSRRDDGFYVIDGQHRHAAALRRGDIPFLPCCVAVYANVAEEAAMFVAMNRARRAINRLDDFHAAQAGGDDEARAIAALIVGAGFRVSRKTGSAAWAPGEVAFTSAIASVRRKHGDGIVSEALQAMAEAFPDERLVAGSSVFTAICRILISPPPGFEKDRLFRALLTFDMKGWAEFLSKSKGGDERAQRLRDALLMAYDDAGKAVAA